MHAFHRSPTRVRAGVAATVLTGALAGVLAAAPAASAAPDPTSGTVVAGPGVGAVTVEVPDGYCAAALDLVSGAGDDPAAQRSISGAVDVSAEQSLLLSPGLTATPTGAPSEAALAGDPPVPLVTTADPHATQPYEAEPQGRISYSFVPCRVPRKPVLEAVTPAGPGAVTMRFLPSMHVPGSGVDVVDGYEASTDDGATWTPVTTWQEYGGGPLLASVDGLDPAVYAVRVRAVTDTGPSPQSEALPVSLLLQLGTPTGVTAVAGTSSVAVGWTAPADATGITGYRVEAVPQGPGSPAVCEAAAAARTCRLGVPAGSAYAVVVSSVGVAGQYETVPAAAVLTGVVPGPAVPPVAPPADGPLQVAGNTTAAPGGSVAVSGSGFLPNSTVTLVVYSTPTVLGTVVTDATGAFSTTVVLPAGLAAGRHTLVASGVDAAGDPYTLASALDVAGAAAPARTGGALAYTGTEVTGPATAGVAALLAGAVLTVAGRRPRRA